MTVARQSQKCGCQLFQNLPGRNILYNPPGSAMHAMPTVSLRKALYDECIRQGVEPSEYANQAVKEKLRDEHDTEVEV